MTQILSPTEALLDEARHGRMFILVDDEDRENEGDLVIPAQFASAEAVNFMARHARGLICLALTRQRVDQLGLPMMSQTNGSAHQTAFTLSIEARDGVTTGISAPDRSRTILTAIDPSKGPADIVTPGHIFPLAAREGGTLVRPGHTEAAVDIARIAGLTPAGVICEIMNDDGTMARLPDLLAFAQRHGLKVGTIADLIAYRRRTERLIERIHEAPACRLPGGAWRVFVYAEKPQGVEHLALVKGRIRAGDLVPVRVHHVDLVADVLDRGCTSGLQADVQRLGSERSGIVIAIRDARPAALTERLRERHLQTVSKPATAEIAVQILADLGVTNIEWSPDTSGSSPPLERLLGRPPRLAPRRGGSNAPRADSDALCGLLAAN